METNDFLRQRETFGLETATPWALPAFRLLFSVPRAYDELVEAWDALYPGTRRSLRRLVDLGFVEHQPGVILNTLNGEPSDVPSRRVARYRTTAAGTRTAETFAEDLRTFEQMFPRTQAAQVVPAVTLLRACVLEDSHARYGISVNHAIEISQLSPRLARWWFARYVERGWIVELPERLADIREVVPAHWRITRRLCRQIETVLDAFPAAPQALRAEFRLRRSRFAEPIDPRRVGLTGATDYDHDVTTQSILAAMLHSPLYAADAPLRHEPRLALPADLTTVPWHFTPTGEETITYQPDALLSAQEMREGRVVNRRVVLEYERFQSRRDAWSHIERFLGWLHTHTLPFEEASLYFVVDSDQRLRTYVQLIEAFADHAIDHPDWLPANPTTLAATTLSRLRSSADPLSLGEWSRITLPPSAPDVPLRPVLHDPEHSPYEEYFGHGLDESVGVDDEA